MRSMEHCESRGIWKAKKVYNFLLIICSPAPVEFRNLLKNQDKSQKKHFWGTWSNLINFGHFRGWQFWQMVFESRKAHEKKYWENCVILRHIHFQKMIIFIGDFRVKLFSFARKKLSLFVEDFKVKLDSFRRTKWSLFCIKSEEFYCKIPNKKSSFFIWKLKNFTVKSQIKSDHLFLLKLANFVVKSLTKSDHFFCENWQILL